MWHEGSRSGTWFVEVDRATESHAAWRRKLVRYLALPRSETVLAITTSRARAQALAILAGEFGLDLAATTIGEASSSADPVVYDGARRRLCNLSAWAGAALREGQPR
jgi:hypothetical protein